MSELHRNGIFRCIGYRLHFFPRKPKSAIDYQVNSSNIQTPIDLNKNIQWRQKTEGI
tara:strand:- start:41 stop:211 length:171 start_codon:yes stop_codon:yes gene_type:complete